MIFFSFSRFTVFWIDCFPVSNWKVFLWPSDNQELRDFLKLYYHLLYAISLACYGIFAICKSPMKHLFCPPKFCITFVFLFSWVLHRPKIREIDNNAYSKFWGANKVHFGRCASCEY